MWHDVREYKDFPDSMRDVLFTDGRDMYIGYHSDTFSCWYSLGYDPESESDKYFKREDIIVKAWEDYDFPEFLINKENE